MKPKKVFYTAAIGLGLFAGTAGIANAVSHSSDKASTSASTTDAASKTATDEADANETGETHDGNADEGNDAKAGYTSSVTVADTTENNDDAAEAATLQAAAKISADEASAAAIKAVPGTVGDVKLENEGGNVVYKVEVTADAGEMDVIVDAGNATILAQHADHHGDHGDHGKDDGDYGKDDGDHGKGDGDGDHGKGDHGNGGQDGDTDDTTVTSAA